MSPDHDGIQVHPVPLQSAAITFISSRQGAIPSDNSQSFNLSDASISGPVISDAPNSSLIQLLPAQDAPKPAEKREHQWKATPADKRRTIVVEDRMSV